MSEQRFFRYDDATWMRETCPKRTDDVTNHCWHRGTCTYTSEPSQHDETCCFCGETIRVQDAPLSAGVIGEARRGPRPILSTLHDQVWLISMTLPTSPAPVGGMTTTDGERRRFSLRCLFGLHSWGAVSEPEHIVTSRVIDGEAVVVARRTIRYRECGRCDAVAMVHGCQE